MSDPNPTMTSEQKTLLETFLADDMVALQQLAEQLERLDQLSAAKLLRKELDAEKIVLERLSRLEPAA